MWEDDSEIQFQQVNICISNRWKIQPTTEYTSGDKPAVGTSASVLRSIGSVDFRN